MRDHTIPARYLRDNFDDQDRIALVLIHRERSEIEQKLLLVEQLASERFQSHLRASNAHGKDIFISMNPMRPEARGRTKADVAAVKHVYLDLDKGGKEALERVLKTDGLPRPHHVLESSPAKHQIIWKVQSFMPSQAENLMRSMSREYGADPAATDVSRVLRLPGFRNHKYAEPHFVRDVSLCRSLDRIYTPSDFPQFQERDIQRPAATPRFGERPPATLDSGVDQSRKDFAYALRQLEAGRDPGVIRMKIADYRRPDGKHPNVDDYAHRTVKNAQVFHARRGFSSSTSSASEDRGGLER